jgi:hypothetical protein
MYQRTHGEIGSFAIPFCVEAEKLSGTERDRDSVLNVAAALFLSQGYTSQVKDQATLEYLTWATEMVTRLGLFGGVHGMARDIDISHMSADARLMVSTTSIGCK